MFCHVGCSRLFLRFHYQTLRFYGPPWDRIPASTPAILFCSFPQPLSSEFRNAFLSVRPVKHCQINQQHIEVSYGFSLFVKCREWALAQALAVLTFIMEAAPSETPTIVTDGLLFSPVPSMWVVSTWLTLCHGRFCARTYQFAFLPVRASTPYSLSC